MASHQGRGYATIVTRRAPVRMIIGAVLLADADIAVIALDGEPVRAKLVQTPGA